MIKTIYYLFLIIVLLSPLFISRSSIIHHQHFWSLFFSIIDHSSSLHHSSYHNYGLWWISSFNDHPISSSIMIIIIPHQSQMISFTPLSSFFQWSIKIKIIDFLHRSSSLMIAFIHIINRILIINHLITSINHIHNKINRQ